MRQSTNLSLCPRDLEEGGQFSREFYEERKSTFSRDGLRDNDFLLEEHEWRLEASLAAFALRLEGETRVASTATPEFRLGGVVPEHQQPDTPDTNERRQQDLAAEKPILGVLYQKTQRKIAKSTEKERAVPHHGFQLRGRVDGMIQSLRPSRVPWGSKPGFFPVEVKNHQSYSDMSVGELVQASLYAFLYDSRAEGTYVASLNPHQQRGDTISVHRVPFSKDVVDFLTEQLGRLIKGLREAPKDTLHTFFAPGAVLARLDGLLVSRNATEPKASGQTCSGAITNTFPVYPLGSRRPDCPRWS